MNWALGSKNSFILGPVFFPKTWSEAFRRVLVYTNWHSSRNFIGQNLQLCNFFCYTNFSIVFGPDFRGDKQPQGASPSASPVEESWGKEQESQKKLQNRAKKFHLFEKV